MKIFADFAILQREGLSGAPFRAVKRKLSEIERALRHFDKHVDSALDDPKLSARSKRFLKTLWYGDPANCGLSLGNRTVQRARMIASLSAIMLHAQGEPSARKLRTRLRMLTTSADLGISEYAEPQLNLPGVRQHFYGAARKAKLDAFGCLDIALVEEKRSLEPRKVAVHMHGAVRARDSNFTTKAAERAASPVGTTVNQCGLRIIKIKARKKDWGTGLTPANVADLAYYVGKMTCGVSVVFTKWGRRRSKTTLHGWQLRHALRQLECYSHCGALETTCGVGAVGRSLRRAWKDLFLRLLDFDDRGRSLKVSHDALERNWTRVWVELGESSLRPIGVR